MPGALPTGDPVPDDGVLPSSAAEGAPDRRFGVYLHVPFCQVRCGYCDFNTYTAEDLPGVSRSDFRGLAESELRFAARVFAQSGVESRQVDTVFFGGGTPSLVPASDVVRLLEVIDQQWGIRSDAEVTVEANPDSISRDQVRRWAEGGVTRVSLGVQSFVPHVLATLDRTHNPEHVPRAVEWVREAGLQLSLDLIYGTPGETAADWEQTVSRVLDLSPDHVSAYSLIVEPGTALARRIHRGEISPIDEDLHADFYERVDDALQGAGFHWYEVSNWSRGDDYQSRHNLGYWRSDDWWGVGPGAHSHVGGVRWWNVKHPSAWAERLNRQVTPGAGREILDADTRQAERIMLGVRLREGLAASDLPEGSAPVIARAIADGWIEGPLALRGRLVLTRSGRLMADRVATDILAAAS